MTIQARFRAPLLALLGLALPSVLPAQNVQPANRIALGAEASPMTRLTGHLPRWVNAQADAGAVPDETPVHLTFVLSRSPERELSFTQLLVDQQNPSSPRYHQWLTPAQIGEQFGPSTDDVAAITQWLSARGMQVTSVAPSRTFIEVSSTTGVVGAALSTSFHHYLLDGESHLSATSEPAIPAGLAVAVSGIDGLSEIPLRSYHTVRPVESITTGDGAHPMYSATGNAVHYVFPGDFAKIYDLSATTSAGYTGTGVKIAIVGRSRVSSTDVTYFEGLAGVPTKLPNVVLAGTDPGQTNDEDQSEATLDVERVLTTATGAQADLVIATTASGGIGAAIQYNIQTLLDPIMSISFGACEQLATASNVTAVDTIFKQAAAEGISTFVSSGDSGASACSASFTTPKGGANEFLAINYLCSSSYVTCVGGTEFNDTTSPALYWSATNSSTYTSALGYIPEGAWNEPAITTTTGGTTTTTYQIGGTGGGASLYIAKPTWQTGSTLADGARDVPDISFTSAAHDGYYGCLSNTKSSDCSNGGAVLFAGTSAAAPGMASIAAILNQKIGASQGNLNPLLYKLAASTPTAFHDATPTSSGVSSCTVTTASMCNNSTPSSTGLTGGLAGYALLVGYDKATGLGSLDVANFITAASAGVLPSSTTTVTASPTTIVAGGTAAFTATVSPSSATGTVQFYSNGTALGLPVPLSGSKASTAATAFATAGTYAITATYSGDASDASSTSAALSFVVTPIPVSGLTATASPTTLSVAAGATTGNTSTITLATTASYSGSVTMSCAVANSTGTIYPPTCSFAPATVTFSGTTTGSSVMTLATTVPHAVSGGMQSRNRTPFAPVGGLTLAGLLLVLIPAKRRRSIGWLAILPLVLLGAITGCGSSGSTATPTTPVGTGKGPYIVTVTATPAAGTAATATVTLTVQ